MCTFLFGLANWYRGISGIISTGFLEFIMFNLYIQTGSLLIPIILHFIIDVKFVFMTDWRISLKNLYTSYAMAYRKLKGYDNEIAILDEAIERLKAERTKVISLK